MDPSIKGIFFFVVFCFLRTLSYVVWKLMYERNPELTPFPMFFMMSVCGILIMVVTVNKRLKKETWDCVTRDQVGSLAFKTISGTVTNIINYTVTKYIPLTIISIV